VRGKQHKENFLKEGTSCVDKLFGLVNNDVWGLSKTPSLDGIRYFVSFTNDLHFEKKS
jgi:hypothetical protein